MDFQDGAAMAGLISVIVALAKVIEALVGKVASSRKKDKENSVPEAEKPVIVQLDPESSRMLRETYESTRNLENIVYLKDKDGVPLVYSPRSMTENVVQIATSMRDVVTTQERTVHVLERIEDKVDDNGRILSDLSKRKV
jgi:nitrate reductase NapAB chaperone NapD